MKLPVAAKTVEDGIRETLTYTAFPREHWRSIRTNNPMERIMREIRRRTRVVGNFPGWSFCTHAGDSPASVHRRKGMGITEIHGYVEAE